MIITFLRWKWKISARYNPDDAGTVLFHVHFTNRVHLCIKSEITNSKRDTNPLNILLPGAFWLVRTACACLCAVWWKSDMIDWRLNCSRFQSCPMCPEHPRFKVYMPRNLKQTGTQSYLTCLKESDGTRRWEDGRKWEVWDKDRKADQVIDIRLAEDFEVPSILSSGFNRVVQQTLFSDNMGSTLERTQSLRD